MRRCGLADATRLQPLVIRPPLPGKRAAPQGIEQELPRGRALGGAELRCLRN